MLNIIATLIIPLLMWMTPEAALSQEKVLLADYRSRPPEMVVDEKTGQFSGPLIEILDEAARKIGSSIKWRQAPFQRSLKELELGSVDVVPRVVLDEERKTFVAYLGPIGYQEKDIVFLVRKGAETLINSYEDLKKITVGVKQDTLYFDRFNSDSSIRKVISGLDDKVMAKQFVAGRFDAMIVLDLEAIEKALKDINFTDYSYANYRYVQKIGNYYGMSKKSPRIAEYKGLNAALLDLVKSGRVKQIYRKYNVPPPIE